MAVRAQNGVLLLHAEPGVLVLHHLHHLLTRDTEVCFCRNVHRSTHVHASNAGFYAHTRAKRSAHCDRYLRVCRCTSTPHTEPACWGLCGTGRGTWPQGSGTCRCWSPQPGTCWSHQSSTRADLKETFRDSVGFTR